ncbi:isocitrate lyase/PEP mutase family protein [Bradyrhizobium sp. C-145]|uniref:isocitrate lyase/PEP mutase family protein n=1 Tax=Bradyrhizobium sp. C-145 TaxID=574727 RepID=UPI00201B7CF4|nr:isocitrate lyase/PEP mutase family protein [Bradyrhizobium sp. C-145]UQR61527.1 isocitrate lyase/PEP mutase family protein [Bradyrhizobium sp. C-145]
MRLRDDVIKGKTTTAYRRMLNEGPLPIVGIWGATPHEAQLAEMMGFKNFGISGASLSSNLLGLPDAGLLTLSELTDATRRVCNAVSIPVTVDCDTGFGNAINVIRTVTSIIQAGAASLFMEDQVAPKRCGFVKGKEIVSIEEAVGKYRAACDIRDSLDPDFTISARTDARGAVGGGMDEVLRRCEAYLRAGVNVLYVEALQSREEIRTVREAFPDALLQLSLFAITPPLSNEEKRQFRLCTDGSYVTQIASVAMYDFLLRVREKGGEAFTDFIAATKDHPMSLFGDFNLTGFPKLLELEKRYLPLEAQDRYEKSLGMYDPRNNQTLKVTVVAPKEADK